MGAKFTDNDLFRLAQNNLSDQDAFKFRFSCATFQFRGAVGRVFEGTADLNNDERNLLERIFVKIFKGGGLRFGGR